MLKNLLLFVLFFCVIFADDWPNFLGPQWNGISSETNISKNWDKNKPKKVWEVPLGAGYSGISVVDNIVYTAYGKNDKEYCVALNHSTGKVIWLVEIGAYFESNIGSGPRATPTIHENKVYIIAGHGDLHCLEAKTGKKIWSYNVFKKFDAENLQWGMCGSVVIYNDFVLYNIGGTDGNSIIAVNKNTGELAWSSGNAISSYATPLVTTLCGEEQAIFFTGEGLVTLNPKNGKELWRYPWSVFKNATTPIQQGNQIFFSSSYGQGAGVLLEISKKNNKYSVEEVWKNRHFKNHYTTSILWDNHLYGFHNAILACVDFKTGENLWTQRGFEKGLIIATQDGTAIVLGQNGNLALVAMSPKEYKELGTFSPFPGNTNCLVIPTLANGMLYLRDDHRLICLDVR